MRRKSVVAAIAFVVGILAGCLGGVPAAAAAEITAVITVTDPVKGTCEQRVGGNLVQRQPLGPAESIKWTGDIPSTQLTVTFAAAHTPFASHVFHENVPSGQPVAGTHGDYDFEGITVTPAHGQPVKCSIQSMGVHIN